MAAYPNELRTKWVLGWPGQAVLAATQFFWTAYVHEAIKGGPKVRTVILKTIFLIKFHPEKGKYF